IATISGRLEVTSLSRRLKTRTASPFRWIWIRAPSSLYSIAVSPPCSARTSSRSSAISASIGFIGARRRRPRDRSASAPSNKAISATNPRSPRNIWAVRTASGSTPAASAIPSSITPSFTPIRISPKTFFRRTSRSSCEARPRSDSSSRRRALVESAPWASAICAKALETSRIVSDRGTNVTCFVPSSAFLSVAHPTFSARASDSAKIRPMTRCTAGATSSLRREHVQGEEDSPQRRGRQDGARTHRTDRSERVKEEDGEDADRTEGEEDQDREDAQRDRERSRRDGNNPAEHRGADHELNLQEG